MDKFERFEKLINTPRGLIVAFILMFVVPAIVEQLLS